MLTSLIMSSQHILGAPFQVSNPESKKNDSKSVIRLLFNLCRGFLYQDLSEVSPAQLPHCCWHMSFVEQIL